MKGLYFLLLIGFFYCHLTAVENRFSVGGQLLYRDYHEKTHTEARSDERGLLPGLFLNYQSRSAPFLFLDGDFSYFEGKTRYLGSLQDLFTGEIEPYFSWTKNIILEANFRTSAPYLNYKIKSLLVAPFLGIGYKFWSRNSSHFDPYGFDETYRWFYLSSGLFLQYQWKQLELAFLGEIRWIQQATIELYNDKATFFL